MLAAEVKEWKENLLVMIQQQGLNQLHGSLQATAALRLSGPGAALCQSDSRSRAAAGAPGHVFFFS